MSLLRIKLTLRQGLVSIGLSIAVISWGTFARDVAAPWQWAACTFDPIIIGAGALMPVALLVDLKNGRGTSSE